MPLPPVESLAPLLPWLLLPLTQLAAAWSKGQVVRALGWWGVPLTTGWIGVPVHELSHVLAARLLGRKVVRVRWFAPDAETGNLGSVEWQPGSGPLAWLAMLTVGFAPLLGGALVLRAMLHGASWAVGLPLPGPPASADWLAWRQAVLALADWAKLATLAVWRRPDPLAWSAVAAWWAMASVAAHLTPSSADLRGAWRGGLAVAVAMTLAVAGCELADIRWQDLAMRTAVGLGWLVAPGLLVAIPAGLAVGSGATVLGWVRKAGPAR